MITPRRRKRDSFLPWVHLAVDVAAAWFLLRAAFWFRFESELFANTVGRSDHPVYFSSFNFIILTVVFFLRFYQLYRPTRLLTFSDESAWVFKAVAASTIFLMAITFFVRGFSYSRTFLVMAGAVLAIGLSLERYLLGLAIMLMDRLRGSYRNVLLLGVDENAKKLIRFYKKNPRFMTRVVGFLDGKNSKSAAIEGVPVLGDTKELGAVLKRYREIHEVILASLGVPTETVLKIISVCEKELVAFRWIADIFGLLTSKMSVAYLAGVPLLSFMDSPLADWENRFLKRAFDVATALAALVFLSPVMAIIAVLVKLDSPGPVFFRQQRIGEDGKRFWVIKFRTMRPNAEEKTGPIWAVANDSRRTKLGAFLRSWNLDELPQFWNVLVGDMSLVGPRPERPYFVSQFKEDIPRYMARHTIRSGITGWAQVNGLRGNTSIEERTKLDLYYIENWSLLLDFKILFMTLFAQKNAY